MSVFIALQDWLTGFEARLRRLFTSLSTVVFVMAILFLFTSPSNVDDLLIHGWERLKRKLKQRKEKSYGKKLSLWLRVRSTGRPMEALRRL
ncbi:hypothetical protein LTR15_003452 [Elasticomyces elasticus]|nr:hypothetical protein LTR15_003452 [Elasticomyces elasticus]